MVEVPERTGPPSDTRRPGLPSGLTRIAGSTRARAAGLLSMAAGRVSMAAAAGAQFSQAAGSLAVSALSMRQPDARVFTALSLLLGALVVATSLSTGLVGDPLTVLDRHDPPVRTALRRLAVAVVAVTSCGGGLGSAAFGLVGWHDGVLFGVLVAVWVAEDMLRRLLMACLRFGRVIVVDLAHLGTVIGVLQLHGTFTHRGAGLGTFLVALITGQLVATALAIQGLPAGEGYVGQASPGRLRSVIAYGLHRALQGVLRPAVLLAMRAGVLAACGTSAAARLETGRIVTAPALLLVSGAGSYLLSRYAARARMRAGADTPGVVSGPAAGSDRAALALTAVTVVSGIGALAAVALFPGMLGPSWSGATAGSAAALVATWSVYVLGVALAMPYASLGAVALPQSRLLGVRGLDTLGQLAAGGALLILVPAAWWLLPLVSGAVSGAATLSVLRPLVGAPARRPRG